MSLSGTVCSERARGASIGATIVGGFGALWLALGMASAGIGGTTAIAAVLPVFALIAWLGITVRRRLPGRRGPETSEKQAKNRVFLAVNVVQWVAIFGTVNLLRNLHLDGWIVPAIVLIVGAHFLPLAQLFRARQHVYTGAAMMAVAAAAVLLPAGVRDTVECLAAGAILWASAGAALYAAFRMGRTPPAAALRAA